MEETGSEDHQRLQLLHHLALMEDLWKTLYYVQWNHNAFVMLVRLAQDMAQSVRQRGNAQLGQIVAQLEDHVKSCASNEHLPSTSDRQRLTTLMDAVHAALTGTAGSVTHTAPATVPLLASSPKLFLIAPELQPALGARLEGAGYRVQVLANWAEARQHLREQTPSALLVDVDFPDEAETVADQMARLRAETGLQVPVLFLAERNDLSARLEAVRAGGAAYFSKPVDSDAVLGVLRELLLPLTSRNYFRVLVVNDQPHEAWEITHALEREGITAHVTSQPLHVLWDIAQLRPDLLVIDLAVQGIDGPDLARAIAQHEDCATLPMILQCTATEAPEDCMRLDAPGASLLLKPTPVPYLCWEIKRQLRRARATRVKLGALTDQDASTGLLNRRRYLHLLEQALDNLGLRLHALTVLFIKLDNLHSIRDSAGVVAADEVLRQAAGRLRRVLSPEQPAARFSDAIFAVLIPNLLDTPLLTLAQRFQHTLEAGVYRVGAHALLLRTSIGLAPTTDRAQDHLVLMQRAESACGLAQEANSERIIVEQGGLRAKAQRSSPSRLRILEQIAEILESQRLWLAFQPIASLRGDASERYEALLRMRTADGQELRPRAVFDVVSRHELGRRLDRWVMERVFELLGKRQSLTTLFIKILPVTTRDPALSDWLRRRLEQAGLEGQRLVFAVAEENAEHVVRDMFGFLGAIKSLGCGFCLERFGKNADSLTLLKNLGADYVKLDRAALDGITDDPDRREQLQALVQSLDALGATTIVSGVEDVQVLPILWSLGVDLVQGFFLQRPNREMSYDFTEFTF